MHSSWTLDDFKAISSTVFHTLRHCFSQKIMANKGDGLRISWSGSEAIIYAEDRSALARGCFLLAQAEIEGKHELNVCEKRHIASCGVMLDCSRGAVMTVDACKRYIDCLSSLGLNLLMLYTEDTYVVPEYPYFGHQRGRYTQQELREIDQYAAFMGVELVPCIQTLAHLEQFLQWIPNEHLQDTKQCLLIDEDETYAFIEAEIRAFRSYVTTNRIHIGMDEAHGVGLGRYFEKHGLTDRFELLRRHLERVVEICKKYDFHPMMWSDMFFRLGSKNGDYYDMDSHVPQRIIDQMPDVDMVYWDYYHTDEKIYDHMMAEHARMGQNTVFAGGLWTWSGFLPQVEWTDATMYPALRCCARHHVQTVVATMWGDDGNETNHFLALNQLPIFSEFCWRADACTKEDVSKAGELLSGLTNSTYQAFSYFYKGAIDERTGKALIYCDLLYPMIPGNPDLSERKKRYETGKALLAEQLDRQECRYADALFDIAIAKCELIPAIRSAYAGHHLSTLRHIVQETIPTLLTMYERLENEHRILWESAYKRNGWETFPQRYGATCGRIRDVAHTLQRYIDGNLETICELDEEPLNPDRWGGYRTYITPQV